MRVYNRKHKNEPLGAVYVGRPSKWGNPFVIGKDGSRGEVVAKYRNWIITNWGLLACLFELRGRDLVCWCAPEACHADVLMDLANNLEVINSFTGQHHFLSNFYPSEVQMYGETYPTVEHAYQAAKSTDPDVRARIRDCDTPGQAKRMGRRVNLRPDWEEFKFFAMEELLRRKFAHKRLRNMLLDLSDAVLIEGNTWGDTIWGVDMDKEVGENNLGQLLMKIREEIT